MDVDVSGQTLTMSVVELGSRCFLRHVREDTEMITPVRLVRAEQVDRDGHGIRLMVEFGEDFELGLESLNRKCVCYLMREGILHQIRCTAIDIPYPQHMLLKASDHCTSCILRRHPRHELHAKVRIKQQTGTAGFARVLPIPINVSLGGFGFRGPNLGLRVGSSVDFELTLLSENCSMTSVAEVCIHGSPLRTSVELFGSAQVRASEQLPTGEYFHGLKFTLLDDEDIMALDLWLQTNQFNQRNQERSTFPLFSMVAGHMQADTGGAQA